MSVNPLAGRCVILVDDDNLFARQIITILEDNDLRVFRARNAETGLKLCKRNRPDFVICDYPLPDMDYVKWITALRMERISQILTISSVQVNARVINELHNVLNIPQVLQKPVSPEQLIGALLQLRPKTLEIDEIDEEAKDIAANLVSDEQSVLSHHNSASEFARRINSISALVKHARQHPGKSDEYLIEALAQTDRITNIVDACGLESLKEPVQSVNSLLTVICDSGGDPNLTEWDLLDSIFMLLDESQMQAPVKAGSRSSAESTEPLNEISPYQSRTAPVDLKVQEPQPTQPVIPSSYLLTCSDPQMSAVLSRMVRSTQSETITAESHERARQMINSSMPLIVIAALPTDEQEARKECLRYVERVIELKAENTVNLIFIMDTATIHTISVACHQKFSYFVPSEMVNTQSRDLLELFGELTGETQKPGVLIINDSLEESEALLRSLSTQCTFVNSLSSAEQLEDAFDQTEFQIAVITEQFNDMSGFDLCRIVRRSLNTRRSMIAMELRSFTPEKISGAYKSGADLVLLSSESSLRKADNILSFYRRIANRRSQETNSTNDSPKTELPVAVRNKLAENFSTATMNQIPLSLLLIHGCSNVPNDSIMSRVLREADGELSTDGEIAANEEERFKHDLFRLDSDRYLVCVMNLHSAKVTQLVQNLQTKLEELQRSAGTSDIIRIAVRSYPEDSVSLSELIAFE